MIRRRLTSKQRQRFKFYCYFCGATEDEARLVCGPASIAICAGCIALAAAELARTSKDAKLVNLVRSEQS